MKANRGDIETLTKALIERKMKGLIIAGEVVKNQAKALCKVGKYLAGSGKVGGALRQSIYSKVEGLTVRIGTNMEYAAAIEFGAHITPVKAKALTIPIAPEAVGQRASDFQDLFIWESNGKVFLAKSTGEKTLKIYFMLLKSVDIPKQPYLRPALAEKKKQVIQILNAA